MEHSQFKVTAPYMYDSSLQVYNHVRTPARPSKNTDSIIPFYLTNGRELNVNSVIAKPAHADTLYVSATDDASDGDLYTMRGFA